jgi:superfamily II DNA or RNA helicase
MHDNNTLATYLSDYEKLTPNHKLVVDVMTLAFRGINQYNTYRVFADLNLLITQTELTKNIKELIKINLIEQVQGTYQVQLDLKIFLYPRLLQDAKNVKLSEALLKIKTIDSWYTPPAQILQTYLQHTFCGIPKKTDDLLYSFYNMQSNLHEYFMRMLADSAYDKALMANSEIFMFLFDQSMSFAEQKFEGFETIATFLQRQPEKTLPVQLVQPSYAQMALWQGNLQTAHRHIENIPNDQSLLISSVIALYTNQYEMSVKCFEAARVTDFRGGKTSKCEFSFYYEFFHWFTFLVSPQLINIKKIDAFINKALKDKTAFLSVLLPLLHLAKKDFAAAEATMKITSLESWAQQAPHNFYALVKLMVAYLVTGNWEPNQRKLALKIAELLHRNNCYLMLNELLCIFEALQHPIPSGLRLPDSLQLPQPLMARVQKQEKWDMALDGLLTLVAQPTSTPKQKSEGNTRIAYIIDFKTRHIQPIQQTYKSTGWSAGRNVALSRFKALNADGMSDQDKEAAASMATSSSYYGSRDYYFDFDKTLPVLCGHPYLYLSGANGVPLELVKGQPELLTEETSLGIRLKSSITLDNHYSYLIKETQTRYKVIAPTPVQRKALELINKGILIPKNAKEKLLQTMMGLSGIMSVQSNLEGAPSTAKSIDADPRIRIQIVPMADGLKAEAFVKPLGSIPPYFKPGKGNKGVYGEVNGEKVHALRNLKHETDNWNKLAEGLDAIIDDDLVEEDALFDDPYACLALLEAINQYNDVAVVEWPEGERFKVNRTLAPSQLQLRVSGKGQWFDVDGELQVDEQTVLAIKDVLKMAKKGNGRFLEVSPNTFLALTEELRKQIAELEALTQSGKDTLKLHPLAAHSLENIGSEIGNFKTDKHWDALKKRIKNAEKTDLSVPATLDAELRPYQEEGFRWMAKLQAWGAGACLADDMGLGKTLQAIAMMLRLAQNGPLLVVCPASVVPNWCSELRKFAPTLTPIVLKNNNREETFAALGPFDVLVVTYGLLQTEEERFAGIQWAMAVLDEAHVIKNALTKSSQSAMKIEAGFKLALTGTPIQNHLGELWNLFQFCNPGLLGSLTDFSTRYVKSDDTSRRAQLKKLIHPFMLRRTKNTVLDELPPKTEITQSIELSDAEMAFYEAMRQQAVEALQNNDQPNGAKHLQALAEITKLRLACCHTSLANKEIVLPSSKHTAFMDIVEELSENKHRALVFSQFVGHLALIRQTLDKKKIPYQYLDGSTPMAERQAAVKAFQAGKGDLFLISLKAGGLGLNLTAADYVIHLDPWWNPAVEDQASDRAHRMGQTRPVTIYRLVAKNTIEEKIVQLHATKRDLADSLLEGSDQSGKLSTNDLIDLLRTV